MTIPYDPKKGLSREFLAYFAQTLNEIATQGLDDLMDFLSDRSTIDFGLDWDAEAFEKGRAELVEGEFTHIRGIEMVHEMLLAPKPFEMMKSGPEDAELRLYDEKRKHIQIGDRIRFYCTENQTQTIEV